MWRGVKPVLRMRGGVWLCCLFGMRGRGATPREAYDNLWSELTRWGFVAWPVGGHG